MVDPGRRSSPLPPTLAPRGLNRQEAAAYVGVGVTLFDEMVNDGRMPKPIEVNSRGLWDRQKLDSHFDALADKAATGEGVNDWDNV
jgi:hypothetical protein